MYRLWPKADILKPETNSQEDAYFQSDAIDDQVNKKINIKLKHKKCPIFMVYLKKECIFTELFINQNRNHSLQYTFTNEKQVFYAGIIKCTLPGDNKFIGCRFSIIRFSETFLLQEVIEMLEKGKICRWEVRWWMV